jgi:hypothetical protein
MENASGARSSSPGHGCRATPREISARRCSLGNSPVQVVQCLEIEAAPGAHDSAGAVAARHA